MNSYQLAKQSLQRHGLMGCARKALSLMHRAAGSMPYLRECHVWYRLDLRRDRPRVELPAGFQFAQAGAEDLPLLERLETNGRWEALRRLEAGASLWIVREGERAAFSCWTFQHHTPVLAARGGWLMLPPGSVCMEDSVTAADYRGRGIAPAAWTGVADAMARLGIKTIVGKVKEENAASRHALEKIGFQAVATMEFERVWLRARVKIRAQQDEPLSMFLAQRLTR